MTSGIAVDVDRRVVFTHAVNPLTVAQVADHRVRLCQHPLFDPQFNQIISFLDVVDVELSANQLRGLAKAAVFSAQSRRAFIVPSDLLFGMGWMFAAHRDYAGEPYITIVRSVSEAADWVGVDRAVAQRALASVGGSPGLDGFESKQSR